MTIYSYEMEEDEDKEYKSTIWEQSESDQENISIQKKIIGAPPKLIAHGNVLIVFGTPKYPQFDLCSSNSWWVTD